VLLLQAISSYLLFGESLPLSWCLGAILIVTGLVLINSESEQPEDAKLKMKTK
jgi:drug/metabolite transporter (DMT)-like permease